MTINHETHRQATMLDHSISIEHSLRPLWKTSYYTGILLDWCRRIPKRRTVLFSIHIIVMSIFSWIIFVSCTFQFVQLLFAMLKETNIHSIIPNLMWFSHYPVNVMVVLGFNLYKEDLLSYFEDFAALERSITRHLPKNSKQSFRRLYRNLYNTYALQGIGLTIVTGWIMSQKLDGASYLLSYYPILKDTLTMPVIVTFHLASTTIGNVHLALSNLVPAWTFYHCGILLESLAFQVESHTITNDKNFDITTIKNRFQNVCRLTERANKLFGFLVVIDHLTILFMTCVLSYTILSSFSGGGREILVYLFALITYIGHFAIPVLMTAHLRTGFNQLRSAVVGLLNSEKNTDKVRTAKLFLTTMKVNQSAARPLNLYDITPSTLLSFASLTVGYVIVLLQSKLEHVEFSL